jgi:hypothetical protein
LKKFIPYILIALVIAAVVMLVTGSNEKKHSNVLDERLSFQVSSKIPYGTWVAYNHLKHIFPSASVSTNKKEPGTWDSLSIYGENQALIIVSPEFNADRSEMRMLINFAENGNDVFISAMDLPYEVKDMLRCEVNSTARFFRFFGHMAEADTMTITLDHPPFSGVNTFTYPGKRLEGYFSSVDTMTSTVLGHDGSGRADFIHLKAGKGNVYVHLSPMTFTNYFLLHKKNLPFYEKTISLLSPNSDKVVWDEYYLYKRDNQSNDPKKKNWLSILLNTEIKTGTGVSPDGAKPFKVAFWVLLLLLLLYVLNEMRRKQKVIALIKKPRNESLDFVKTIGRLYHDKGDHRDLCKKMSAYFLEHVRNRYKLPTNELNDAFIKNLHNKTNIDEVEIGAIVSFIKELEKRFTISERQMIAFHQQLESFYKKE